MTIIGIPILLLCIICSILNTIRDISKNKTFILYNTLILNIYINTYIYIIFFMYNTGTLFL